MKKDEIDELFARLEGQFDNQEPFGGHQSRFIEKLNSRAGTVPLNQSTNNWWKTIGIAASFLLAGTLSVLFFSTDPSLEEKVAEISPEVSQTEFYFANLIEQRTCELKDLSSPETKKLVDDALSQLTKLERDYKKLTQDLINGGDSKLILSAMITNFQTRIDLLQDVLDKIENIKNSTDYEKNTTI